MGGKNTPSIHPNPSIHPRTGQKGQKQGHEKRRRRKKHRRPAHRWLRRIFLATVIIVGVIVAAGYYVARRYFNGAALANRITTGFNKSKRGRLEIGKINWKPRAILALMRNGYDDVTVTDLRIYDSRGQVALHIPEAVGRIKLWDIILRGDFVLEFLRARQGTIRLDRYLRPDGPSDTGDPYEIGLFGALEDKKKKRKAKPKPASAGPARQSLMVIKDFDLSGLRVVGDLGKTGFRLHDVSLRGSLDYASAAGKKRPWLHYDLKPGIDHGTVTVADKQLTLGKLVVNRLQATKKNPDRVVVDAILTVDEATIRTEGGLVGLGSEKGPQLAFRATAENFGGLIGRFTERDVIDRGSRLDVRLSGALADPVAHARLSGLGMRHNRVVAQKLQLAARYAAGIVRIQKGTVEVAGGRVDIRGRMLTGSKAWKAGLRLSDISVGDVVYPTPAPTGPEAKPRPLEGKLSGWIDAAGALDNPTAGWTRYDMVFTRADDSGPLPERVRSHGLLHAKPERLDIRQLVVSSADARLGTSGKFWPKRMEMDLALKAQADKLRRLFLKLKQPPLLAALKVAGRARGRVFNPRFDGRAAAYGIVQGPVKINTATTAMSLRSGNLDLYGTTAGLWGGVVRGQGRVALYDRDVRRMHKKIRLRANGTATDLDSAVPSKGSVESLLSGTFFIRGTPGALFGTATANSRVVHAGGQWYRDLRTRVNLRPDAVVIERGRLWREGPRWARGQKRRDGEIWFTPGSKLVTATGKLAIGVNLEQLPLAMVPGLGGPRPAMSGLIDRGKINVQGNLAAPVLDGFISLVQAKIRGFWAGAQEAKSNGIIRFVPSCDTPDTPARTQLVAARDDPAQKNCRRVVTQIRGALFDQMVQIVRGKLDLRQRKRGITMRVQLDRIPIERFLPELQARGDVEGVLSGYADLTVGGPEGIKATIVVPDSDLALRIRQTDLLTQKIAVEEMRNVGKIQLRYDGKRLHVDRMVLTDGERDVNRIHVSGYVDPKQSFVRVRGRANLAAVGMLLGQTFQHMSGRLGVDLAMTGPASKPIVRGRLYPAGIVMRPHFLYGNVTIRAGEVSLSNEMLELRRVRVVVGDDEVDVWGLIGLNNWRPSILDLEVTGNLSPQALVVAMGDDFGRATGETSDVHLHVTGTVDTPLWDGTVHLNPMTLALRGLDKEIRISSGRVVFKQMLVTLEDIHGNLGEGTFNMGGSIQLKGPEGSSSAVGGEQLAGKNPVWSTMPFHSIDLWIKGNGIRHRSGSSYEVELNAEDKGGLRLTGNRRTGLTLAGKVDIVNGRYFQKIAVNPLKSILSLESSRVYESSAPFYEGKPYLENLRLALTVDPSGDFRVKNNIADIGIGGTIVVKGTLANPEIGGIIQLKEGTFKIPYLRGEYTLTSGSINFDQGKSVGKSEAYVNVVGSMGYTDRNEQPHEITLTVKGYTSELIPTWTSDTGLSSSQALALLLTGRTPDELRQGRAASLPTLAPIISEYLPFDFDPGPQSVKAGLTRELGRYFKLRGEVELGYSGQQRLEGLFIVRILDNLSFVIKGKRSIQGEDVTADDKVLSGRISIPFKIRLRGNLKRALGF